MTIALNATANVQSKAYYTDNTDGNFPAECSDYTYTFDLASVGTDSNGTWITFTEDSTNSEWDLTVDPGDYTSRVGTYQVDIHVCYTDFLWSCAPV